MIRLTAKNTFVLAEDGESPRTISGIAVPWGVEATVSDGTRVKFERGSLPVTGKKPKLLKYHDAQQPVGVVTGRIDAEDGMVFTARISATSEGNDMLELIKDEAVDAVSVGVEVIDGTYDEAGTLVISKADWQELSLVTAPAFKGATITEVAATAPQEESQPMSDKIEAASVEAPAPAPQMLWAESKQSFKLPTPTEYMSKFIRGGAEFAEFNARIKAAAPDITTGDTPGILPQEIVSPVYDSLNPIRPFVTAIGTRAMPQGGATFRRPKITVRPTVTQQPTGQLNALDPSTVTVANNDISKLTFGTYVTLSEQDLDWTDPNSLAIVLNQLAIAYGQATDNYAVDQMVAATTQTETITDLSSSADWIEAIYGAAYQISNASNYLPTHFFAAPLTWAKLGMIAGSAAGFEFYEQQKGAISVDVPSTLGRTIAFRGYAAVFMADATKFVKLLKS
jgi:HK97 family phage prohead protease